MGNLCSVLNPNPNHYKQHDIPVATPVFDYSPNYLYTNENLKESKKDFSQNESDSTNRVIIINNQQHPYYYPDPTASAMNGFLTGMLVGELLDDDCL